MNGTYAQVLCTARLSRHVERNIYVGKRFVFIDQTALPKPVGEKLRAEYARISFAEPGVESETSKLVLPITDQIPFQFENLHVQACPLAELNVSNITSDRMLYRQGKDQIHLLAICPESREGKLEIVVFETVAGEYLRQSVEINLFGIGTTMLSDLPAGNYRVFWHEPGSSKSSPHNRVAESECEFTVAEYKLAALVAEVQHFEIQRGSDSHDADLIEAQLVLTSYGLPTQGEGRFVLAGDGHELHVLHAEIVDGKVTVRFPVSGVETLSINVQIVNDPSRTATVMLHGSASNDRETTLFSRLGPVVQGSLVPATDCRSARGLHFTESGIDSEPVHVRQPEDGTITLEFKSDFEGLCIQFIRQSPEGAFPPDIHRRCRATAGDEITLPISGALVLVGVAGFVGGKPWEGWCAVVVESQLKPRISVRNAQPDAPSDISIEAEAAAIAYVIVKDARLPSASTPTARLASRIKTYVENHCSLNDGLSPRSAKQLQSPFSILIFDGTISASQLLDAARFARTKSISLSQALILMEYATAKEVCQAVAKTAGKTFVDLELLEISEHVLEYVPESVARENLVFPILIHENTLLVAISDPSDIDVIEKLRFILNKQIITALATRESIRAAINRHYGQMAGESADSLLREFTDTVIDFTETVVYASAPTSLSCLGVVGTSDLQPERANAIPEITDPNSTEQGSVLFARMIPVVDGKAECTVFLSSENRDYTVDAFVVSGRDGFDWASTATRFRAEKNPSAEFDLPQFIHPKDGAEGRLWFSTKSGKVKAQVFCDGEPVELFHNGAAIHDDSLAGPASGVLTFLTLTGKYAAVVQDMELGESATCVQVVGPPGELQRITRPILLLKKGERISLDDDSQIHSIKILENLMLPLRCLITATSNYEHLCCEQTAAKIRAGVSWYLLDGIENPESRLQAENVIVTGVKRQKSMWLKGRGFKVYPDSANTPSPVWGAYAAKHLHYLGLLQESPAAKSSALDEAIKLGLKMAKDVIRLTESHWPAQKIRSPSDAYEVIRFSHDEQAKEAALKWVREKIQSIISAEANQKLSSVERRTDQAYLAASLLRSHSTAELELAIRWCMDVLKAIEGSGRLYSTVDSTAAIAMISEVVLAGSLNGGGTLLINDQPEPIVDATKVTDEIRSVAVTGDHRLVQVCRIKHESWEQYDNNVKLNVSLRQRGSCPLKFNVAQSVDLVVEIKNGYRFGDFLDICLPDSLSWLRGGGQVKQFTVDFAGNNTISVPLVATGISMNSQGTPAAHHFAICVRNMYDEQRIGNPGALRVTIVGNQPVFHEVLG